MIFLKVNFFTPDFVHALVQEKVPDVQHLDCHLNKDTEYYKDLCELSYQDFLKEYWKNAIPVKCQYDADFIKARFNCVVPVVVPEREYLYYSGSPSYNETISSDGGKEFEKTPSSYVKDYIEKMKGVMSLEVLQKAKSLMDKLVEESLEWRYR